MRQSSIDSQNESNAVLDWQSSGYRGKGAEDSYMGRSHRPSLKLPRDGAENVSPDDREVLRQPFPNQPRSARSHEDLHRMEGETDALRARRTSSISMDRSREPPRGSSRKLQSFRNAERAGRAICVCSASAHYERERIAIGKERDDLKKEWSHLRDAQTKVSRSKHEILEQRLNQERISQEAEETDRGLRRLAAELKAQEGRVAASSEELQEAEIRIGLEKEKMDRREVEVEKKIRMTMQEADQAKEQERKNSKMHEEALGDLVKAKRLQSDCQEERKKLNKKCLELEALKEKLKASDLNFKERTKKLTEAELTGAKREDQLAFCQVKLQERDETLLQRENDLNVSRKEVDDSLKTLRSERAEFEKVRNDWEASREGEERQLANAKMECEDRTGQMRILEEDIERRAAAFEEDIERRATAFEEDMERRTATLERMEAEVRDQEVALTAVRQQTDEEAGRWQDLEHEMRELEQRLTEREAAVSQLEREAEETAVHLEAERSRLLEEQAESDAQRQAVAQQVQEIDQLAAEFSFKEAELHERLAGLESREQELVDRERIFTDSATRSEWMNTVWRDVRDEKEQLILRHQALEWERQTLEKAKRQLQDEQARHHIQFKERVEKIDRKEKTLEIREKDHTRTIRSDQLESNRRRVGGPNYASNEPLSHRRRHAAAAGGGGTLSARSDSLEAAMRFSPEAPRTGPRGGGQSPALIEDPLPPALTAPPIRIQTDPRLPLPLTSDRSEREPSELPSWNIPLSPGELDAFQTTGAVANSPLLREVASASLALSNTDDERY